MLIFPNAGLVLLATPKTGSTALEKALRPHADIAFTGKPSIRHMRYQAYLRLLDGYVARQIGQAPITCAAIRHPVDWLSSWYRYRRRDDLLGKPNSTADVTFDAFVTAYLDDDQPPFAKIGRQYQFLTSGDHSRRVDRIFRYEDGGLVRFCADRLTLTLELPRVNVSPEMGVSLSDAVRTELMAALADDFDMWEQAER